MCKSNEKRISCMWSVQMKWLAIPKPHRLFRSASAEAFAAAATPPAPRKQTVVLFFPEEIAGTLCVIMEIQQIAIMEMYEIRAFSSLRFRIIIFPFCFMCMCVVRVMGEFVSRQTHIRVRMCAVCGLRIHIHTRTWTANSVFSFTYSSPVPCFNNFFLFAFGIFVENVERRRRSGFEIDVDDDDDDDYDSKMEK